MSNNARPGSSKAVDTLATRKGRFVVPLFNTSFTLNGNPLQGRYEIMPDVWIGALVEEESDRIARSLATTDTPRYRIEFHNQTWKYNPADPWWRDPDIILRVDHYLSLISCVIRMSPRREGAVADTWDGSHWNREFPIGLSGGIARGSRRRHSYLIAERMKTWAQLVPHWPPSGLDPRIYVALRYYTESIAEFREDNASSLAMAAISLETLLGGDFLTEVTRSLAQRGAMLTARGEDAVKVYSQLKKLYRARSKLVHEGKPPEEEQLVYIHRFLMRALPSMSALVQKVGSHQRAVQVLDESLLIRRTDLDYLFDAEDRWWDYVPSRSFAP
jgi:hypothetical protein